VIWLSTKGESLWSVALGTTSLFNWKTLWQINCWGYLTKLLPLHINIQLTSWRVNGNYCVRLSLLWNLDPAYFFLLSRSSTWGWSWGWNIKMIASVLRVLVFAAQFCLGVRGCRAALWSAPSSCCELLSSVFTVLRLQRTRKGPRLARSEGAYVDQLRFLLPPFFILTTATSLAQTSPASAADHSETCHTEAWEQTPETDEGTASRTNGRFSR